jgi:hypothetical protein
MEGHSTFVGAPDALTSRTRGRVGTSSARNQRKARLPREWSSVVSEFGCDVMPRERTTVTEPSAFGAAVRPLSGFERA